MRSPASTGGDHEAWRAGATLALGCVVLPAAAQTLAADTKWVGERGSELTITGIDAATGALTGSYVTMAAFPCKAIPHPAAG